MKAMIFAAGLGTRLAPLTDTMPKAMVKVGGKPMLQMQIEKLRDAGFTYIVVNTHHFSNLVKDFIKNNDFGVEIVISDETDMLLNTGGGLKNAQKYFQKGDVFLLHNVDIYSEIDLTEIYRDHIESENIVTMAVCHRKSTNYLLFDETDRLCGWKSYKTNSQIISIKKPTYNEMAFSGIYMFNYEIFNLIKKEGAFSIIPELLDIAKTNRIGGWQHDNDYILDLGKHEALKEYERLTSDN